MKKVDILQMVVNKVEQVKNQIELDYSKGKITLGEKNTSLFYTDQIKYDVQKTLHSLTIND